MINSYERLSMGWIPDYPSIRDFTPETDKVPQKLLSLNQKKSVKEMLEMTGVHYESNNLASSADLRAWFSPVENQGTIGSCTAQAGIGLFEYYERRCFGKHIDASRLFLYKVTRNLLHWTGDTGAFLRNTMEAMVLFGAPPEEYFPYDITKLDLEPSPFCYSFGQNYQAITYYRLDSAGTSTNDLLKRIKTHIACGLPSMFGFTCYNSLYQAQSTGKIPYPSSGEKIIGGHAVITAGYDDNMVIKNTNIGGKETKGALLIRNSWGSAWGNNGGYLWLPYEYVIRGLAVDWWSMLKQEWVDTEVFRN